MNFTASFIISPSQNIGVLDVVLKLTSYPFFSRYEAILEGATMVRIGSALFGARNYT